MLTDNAVDAGPGEETLDPADWGQFEELATRMVSETLEYLATLRDRPAWRAMPDEVRASFHREVPWDGVGEEAAYESFVERVRPYTNGNLDPRFFGWVQGNGTPLGMMADMLAAAINPHMAGFDQAPAEVEHEVLRWLAELMGMPGASGIMVSGGTMANTIGLAVARRARATFDVRRLGMQGAPRRMTLYGSDQTHGWGSGAADLLGLGSDALRLIPTDAGHRIRLPELAAAIRADRERGFVPFCVIGTAGTVNTGAIDDLDALADLCHEQDLWFHVDGAFGALARLSPQLRPMVAGLERADSIGFDLHKWGYLPFECACALVRDPKAHTDAFSLRASYLAQAERGVIAGGLPFADRGVELTRGFKALKVWMSFQAHGVRAIARLIEQNVRQARYLAARVDETPELERLAEVPLNIVCFRYRTAAPDELNQEILLRLQEEGIAIPSSTVLDGRYAIRVAVVNHRTRTADLDALLDAVVRIGRELGPA